MPWLGQLLCLKSGLTYANEVAVVTTLQHNYGNQEKLRFSYSVSKAKSEKKKRENLQSKTSSTVVRV